MEDGWADGRWLLTGAAGAALWVLIWLVVQLHGAYGWALPLTVTW